jgi:hypothetical protein
LSAGQRGYLTWGDLIYPYKLVWLVIGSMFIATVIVGVILGERVIRQLHWLLFIWQEFFSRPFKGHLMRGVPRPQQGHHILVSVESPLRHQTHLQSLRGSK